MGRYTFTLEEVLAVYPPVSLNAIHQALKRLIDKQRIALVKRNFYVIVPMEYRQSFAPPASWYIHDLMEHLQLPYYVGLLSAAAIYGATHQQPQEFQVITSQAQRTIHVGRSAIHFHVKKNWNPDMTRAEKVPTGKMMIAVPEMVILDIIRYPYAAGYWSNIAIIIQELKESISLSVLMKLAEKEPVSLFQRLGYFLERQTGITSLTENLHICISAKKPRYQFLDAEKSAIVLEKNKRWHILINSIIEEDE